LRYNKSSLIFKFAFVKQLLLSIDVFYRKQKLNIIIYIFEFKLLISALFATLNSSQLYSKLRIFILDNRYKITKSIEIKKANLIQRCVVLKNKLALLYIISNC
jgi:hypothetical protein